MDRHDEHALINVESRNNLYRRANTRIVSIPAPQKKETTSTEGKRVKVKTRTEKEIQDIRDRRKAEKAATKANPDLSYREYHKLKATKLAVYELEPGLEKILGAPAPEIKARKPKSEIMQRDKTRIYSYSQFEGLLELTHLDKVIINTYSTMSICWRDRAPVLRVWRSLLENEGAELTLPIDDWNARPLSSSSRHRVFQVIAALRQGCYCPWETKADYEIYRITVEHNLEDDSWSIKSLKALTDNRETDILPVYSPNYQKIAYVHLEKHIPSIIVMNYDGTQKQEISRNSTMPFFLKEGLKLIYLKDVGGYKDFFVYDLIEKKERRASYREIVQAVKVMPYSKVKSQYLLAAGFSKNATPLKQVESLKSPRIMTFTELIRVGLRNSPEVLRDYNELLEALSNITENVYDIGPDFFATGYYSLANDILFQPSDFGAVGDHIARENFLRLVGGLSIPIIPNIPLRLARYSRDNWDAEAARQRLCKTINEFIKDLITAYFDYVEFKLSMYVHKQLIEVNKSRLKRYKKQFAIKHNLRERVIFAETNYKGALSEYNNNAEKLIAAQYKLAMLLGINIDRELIVKFPEPEKLFSSQNPPPLEWFQAQAQVNHPDIHRLSHMVMRSAAERDMGPPEMRIDALRVSVSYGVGLDNWSKLVDDFLLLGMSHIYPLRLPIYAKSYYDKWTGRIDYYRQEQVRTRGQIKYDVHEAFRDLNVLLYQKESRECRRSFYRERVRLAKIYRKLGRLGFQRLQIKNLLVNTLNKVTENEVELKEDQLKVINIKCEFYRRMAKLYSASGIAFQILPKLFKSTAMKQPDKKTKSIYLWKSLEVVKDRKKRKQFLDFCTKYKFNRIYCFISRTKNKKLYLQEYDLEYLYFMDLCQARKIQVYALMGNTEWLLNSYRDEIKKLMGSLEKFNHMCIIQDIKPFAGIKIDVEPHALASWKDSQQRIHLCYQYLSLLDFLNRTKERSLKLAVDIPYTYNGIKIGCPCRDFLAQISRNCDEMTIMGYLNKEKLILKKVMPIFVRRNLDIPIEVAFETAQVNEKYISFAGINYANMMKIINQCAKVFSEYNNFQGVAFHDYHGILKLVRKRGDNHGNKTSQD
jgi:outer membrane protein TolC